MGHGVCQVKIKGSIGMPLYKIPGLLGIGPGCIMLIYPVGHHFITLKVNYRVHIIAVGNAKILIKTSLKWQILMSVAQVPFPNNTCCISPVF